MNIKDIVQHANRYIKISNLRCEWLQTKKFQGYDRRCDNNYLFKN